MFQRLLLMPVLLGALALFGSADAAPARWGQWQNALKPSGAPATPIALARSGQTDYTIVIPTDPTPQEQKAAEELAAMRNSTDSLGNAYSKVDSEIQHWPKLWQSLRLLVSNIGEAIDTSLRPAIAAKPSPFVRLPSFSVM